MFCPGLIFLNCAPSISTPTTCNSSAKKINYLGKKCNPLYLGNTVKSIKWIISVQFVEIWLDLWIIPQYLYKMIALYLVFIFWAILFIYHIFKPLTSFTEHYSYVVKVTCLNIIISHIFFHVIIIYLENHERGFIETSLAFYPSAWTCSRISQMCMVYRHHFPLSVLGGQNGILHNKFSY